MNSTSRHSVALVLLLIVNPVLAADDLSSTKPNASHGTSTVPIPTFTSERGRIVYTRGSNLDNRISDEFSDLFHDTLITPVIDVLVLKLRYRFGL